MRRTVLRTKPVEQILSEAEGKKDGLKRVLSVVDLTAIGVGAVIGAGIFVLTGTAARDAAGPAIMLSYIFAGIACILAALCYAEFASRLPISGSAYTYAYASVGELFAWIIGWDLILEYTIGSATVAVGWTHYLTELLEGFGLTVPAFLLAGQLGPLTINWAAMLLVASLTVLLCLGIKESARVNTLMVLVKLLVVLFVIVAGIPWVQPEHWQPFFPYGVQGVFAGAALIFFAYIGFDAVSTAAEEVENPQRNLPIGLIASLTICTLLYVSVAAVITGMVPYGQIDPGAPLAAAFGSVGNLTAKKMIALGGFVGLTTVVLVLMMSQPRIWYAMARDGLLWPWFSRIHPRFRSPFNATLLTGLIAGLMAGLVPLEALHHTVSIGTLFAFVVVSASVLIMRYKTEDKPQQSIITVLQLVFGLGLFCLGLATRFSGPAGNLLFDSVPIGSVAFQWVQILLMAVGLLFAAKPLYQLFTWKGNPPSTFRCPGVPLVPIAAIAANIYMMVNLNLDAWLRLWIWLALGIVIYIFYGRHHSKLNK